MKSQTASNLRVCGIIFGGFLTNIPIGVAYYYGNISTYIDSYYIATEGSERHTAGSIWLPALWDGFVTIGIFVSEYISHRIGARFTLLVGMILLNLSIYISYFTLRSSFWSLHITLGILTGIASGFCYSMILIYVASWATKMVGLSSAVVVSALGGGGLFYNLAATFYINPRNLEPDINVGESRYFSQPDIIERVPYVFWVLGALTTCCHVIAFPLMKNHPDWDKKENKKVAVSKSPVEETSCFNGTDRTVTITEQYGATEIVDLTMTTNQQQYWVLNDSEERNPNNTSTTVSVEEQTITSFTPLMALKSKTFYLAAISSALFAIGFIVENSSYKQFGIVYINDDYFLTNIGVGINIVSFLSRIISGLTLDMFSVKSVLVFLSFFHTILSVFWYFAPLVNKWFYLFWTLILQAAQSGSIIVYPILALKYFGSDYYMTIYGMMLSFSVILVCASPTLTQLILSELGWFWLFFFVSATNFVSVILNICLPDMS